MIAAAFNSGKSIKEDPAQVDALIAMLPWIDDLHIRFDEHQEVDYRELLDALPEDALQKVWIHDYHEMAVHRRLKGFHISRYAAEENESLGIYAAIHNLQASISCHNLDDLGSAVDLYDRVFISPVFDSISKPGHARAFSHTEIRESLKAGHDAEIIALGGVQLENIDAVQAMGFDGFALKGALWNAGDPEAYAKQIHFTCRSLAN